MMAVLVVGAGATWAMVGLIWVVQVVHYPMLAEFSAVSPIEPAVEHQRRISWVVGPLLAVEGITALVLLIDRPATMGAASAWAAASLLGIALLSTALVQVPLHGALAKGHDAEVARRLISTNWIRTAAWTARGLVLGGVLVTGGG